MDDPAGFDADEHAIAAGLRAGSPDAWGRLHDLYAERVWRAVARLSGGCESAVADVVQETFLAAARSARAYDPARGGLWAWLFGVARTQTLLHLRKRARHGRERDPAHASRLGTDSGGGPLGEILARESAELVRLTLLELPADYGRLLTLKYLLDVSVDDIARAERLGVVATRSKLARAREAFRAQFGHRDPRDLGGAP